MGVRRRVRRWCPLADYQHLSDGPRRRQQIGPGAVRVLRGTPVDGTGWQRRVRSWHIAMGKGREEAEAAAAEDGFGRVLMEK